MQRLRVGVTTLRKVGDGDDEAAERERWKGRSGREVQGVETFKIGVEGKSLFYTDSAEGV